MSPETPTSKCSQCGKSFPANVRICPDDGTVLEHDTQTSQLGKVLDGKYRLDSFLSQGGMGGVYKATHVMLGKTVAVKLINPELVTSPEVVRRFQREARAATALNHPNIVAVFDLGQTAEGTLYIAMEFVDGPSLKSAITSGGPMAPARAVTLMRQIGNALSIAHRNKIIHRDLKPQNIMLARSDDGQEIAKLVDFGIAKTFDEATQLTMAGDAIGTPHYMAPEQAAGQPVDARSDLYSAGIILYEMLSGEVPFNDTSAPAILIKHLQEIPLPPSVKNPKVTIPPALEAIALKCLEKTPAARFQTADELCAALDQAATSIPGAAPGTSSMLSQATLPIAAAGTKGADDLKVAPAWAAATAPMAAAPAPAATARLAASPAGAQAAPATKTSGDTRPTVVPAAQQPPPVAAPGVHAEKPSSSKGLLFVAAVVVAMLGVAGYLYMQQQRDGQPPQATTAAENQSTAPAASPAMAPEQSAPSPGAPPVETASAPILTAPAAVVPPPTAQSPSAASAARPSPSSVVATPSPGPDRPAPAATAVAAPSAARPSPTTQSAPPTPTRGGGATVAAIPAAFPPNPAVFFQCQGAPEICSPLRTALDAELEKAKLPNVRSADRADITVMATASVLSETSNRQFGTNFTVRNYGIDVAGEAPKLGETVLMPPQGTVSFDQSVGAERANEKARVMASDIVQKLQAFAAKKK
jgi:hypothetical protein